MGIIIIISISIHTSMSYIYYAIGQTVPISLQYQMSPCPSNKYCNTVTPPENCIKTARCTASYSEKIHNRTGGKESESP